MIVPPQATIIVDTPAWRMRAGVVELELVLLPAGNVFAVVGTDHRAVLLHAENGTHYIVPAETITITEAIADE